MILCAQLQRGLQGELSQFYNDSQILLNLTIQHRAIAPLIYASVLTSIRALQFSAAMVQVNFEPRHQCNKQPNCHNTKELLFFSCTSAFQFSAELFVTVLPQKSCCFHRIRKMLSQLFQNMKICNWGTFSVWPTYLGQPTSRPDYSILTNANE